MRRLLLAVHIRYLVALLSCALFAQVQPLGAAGSASFVQAIANVEPGTAPSLAFANNTAAGDLIMVGIDFDGTASPSSISDTQGNTFVPVGSQLTSPEGTGSRVYYAKNIAGGADTVTVHWTVASTDVEIYLVEYSGLDPNNPVDAQAAATGPAGAVSSGNATTTVAGDVIYGYCMADKACNAGSGFTARSTYDQNLIEDMTAGSPGSYAATATANNGWNMQMVALKPALPSITSLSLNSGGVGTSVTITGTNFGATQGSNTVTFNGTAATSTAWSNTSITAPVPTGATTGNVVVTVGGAPSNGMNFTVYPGIFVTTGSLSALRYGAVATLLANGKVLIEGGGDNNDNGSPGAELYDPATGSFSTVSETTSPYSGAVLLANGKVLFAGGWDSTGHLAVALLYDPVTGSFIPTGSLNTARGGATPTLLNNGQVLIAGGWAGAIGVTASAELYDPATGTFTVTGSLNAARGGGTATRLNNGKVLMVGGWDTDWNFVASAELYDPATGAFTPTGSPNFARAGMSAVLLNNGQVLIVGGQDASSALASAELYDPATGAFSVTGSLHAAHNAPTATLLNNGQVLVAGGVDNNWNALASAEQYDPVTGSFIATGSLNTARSSQTATRLNNGQVLIANAGNAELYQPGTLTPAGLVSIALSPQNPSVGVGGTQQLVATGTFSDGTETLQSATWSSSNATVAAVSNDASNSGTVYGVALGSATISACAGSVCNSTAVTISPPSITSLSPNFGPVATSVRISGAYFGATPGSSTVTFNGTPIDPAYTTWSDTSITTLVPTGATTGNVVVTVGGASSNGVNFTVLPAGFALTGSLSTGRHGANGTLLDNGKVLITGGTDLNNDAVIVAELYDPATGSFRSLDTTPTWSTVTLLDSGKVLIAGGLNGGNALSSAELYDPAAGTFTPTGSLNVARYGATGTLLNTGQVLIMGGYDINDNLVAGAELYDPATGTFSTTGSLNDPRSGIIAALLNSGKVLLAGGWDANSTDLPTTTAELYDPATGLFTVTGSLNDSGSGTSAVLLNNGKAFIPGGYHYGPIDSAQLYDSATGTFTLIAMNVGGYEQGGTALLEDGTVLIAGGYGPLATPESRALLYDPVAGTFTPTSSMSAVRIEPTAVRLQDGRVLMVGGFDGNGNILSSAELYQPTTLTPAGLVSITVSSPYPAIPPGAGEQLLATGTFSDNSTETLSSVTWSSSATSVATVTNDAGNSGSAYGMVQGSATIKACAGSVCGTTPLTVIIPAPATVTPSNLTQTYTGHPLTPTATTAPPDLGITWVGAPDTNAGTYSVTATVNDSRYQGSASGTFTINKATATVALSNLTQTYTGSPLTPTVTTAPPGLAIALSGAPDTNAGSYSVTATVNDPNYQGSASGTFIINKATPAISWSNPTAITYETVLGATQLNATANTPGTFANNPPLGTVLPVGSNQTLSTIFTPSDTTDYTAATASVAVTVSQAGLVITASGGAITYGGTPPTITPTYIGFVDGETAANLTTRPTCSTTASSSSSVAGSPYPSSCSGAVDSNYSISYVNGSVTVGKATPTISWSNPASIVHGIALSGTQLNATASVPGTFAYSPVLGTVLIAGNQTLSVTFTPTDTTDYNTATATVILVVLNAPTIASLSLPQGPPQMGLTIGGLFFGATQGSSTVKVNGTNATVISWSDSLITVQVPSTTTGNVVVTVGGVSSTGNFTFIVTTGFGCSN